MTTYDFLVELIGTPANNFESMLLYIFAGIIVTVVILGFIHLMGVLASR